jgi:flagellar biosynthetic protein FlhB
MANNQNGERTEHPTIKKKRDSREKGQVPRSRDLSSACSLAGVTMGLSWFGLQMVQMISGRMTSGLAHLADQAHIQIEPVGLSTLLANDAGLMAQIAGPPALVAAAATVGSSIVQHGWMFSTKALQMNWGRMSPAQGLARLGPAQSLPELIKGLVGIAALGTLCYFFIRDFYDLAPQLMLMSPSDSALFGWNHLWNMLFQACIVLAVIGGLDYVYQRWRWFTQLKMTKQEVREEHKSQEGNPEVKGRVRRIQREMMRKRMLSAVKTATVVVTNPTHFAVALHYNRAEMVAPIVVAKGQDEFAARIKDVARKHNVPMVENVALARALYKSAEVGDSIPAALFGAVAEVLAYLVRLKQLVL